MTHWTKGVRQIATEAHCKALWGGDGKQFFCALCGHRFQPGDGWRWQYTGGAGSFTTDDGTRFGLTNFLVCDGCDGPDVIERWGERNTEFFSAKFRALRNQVQR